jgi:hypothetical protein
MYQDSQNNGGTYRELVAAGRIFDCHINIIRPHMPMMRINPCRLDIDEQNTNTLNLVCLTEKDYHACHFGKELQLDTAAMMLLPSGYSIRKVGAKGGDRESLFRALTPFWDKAGIIECIDLRECIIEHIIENCVTTHSGSLLLVTLACIR